ncbi:MAG: hypothetical protein UT97_C0020G0007 [Parcubacteria group bacterium GW2011_GWC2_40_31]|nr:MAG: hypothetical protein UT97_C0020G0007 [Parcubacteria group bacterium GW2011_GWC2_40_31]
MPDDMNQNPLDPQLGLILTLLRDIPILNAVPSDPPKFPIGFAFYDDGVTRRFYIFFNGNWRYVALT